MLCDVRLGDGNGGDCLRHLREAQPGLDRRFVFVTGDIAALADDAGEFGDLPVLTKPFTAADLDRLLGIGRGVGLSAAEHSATAGAAAGVPGLHGSR